MASVRSIALLIVSIIGGGFLHGAASGISIMPLSDVEPGMEGEWLTAIRGNEIAHFPLKVIGVADGFAGPGSPVIICEALDADNILSGPVQGMSGSPVFVDGKLIGAYAYGFAWPKEQAIIGVTPIGDMLDMLEVYPPESSAIRTQTQWRTVEPGKEHLLEDYQSFLQTLPMGLSVSGVSARTLAEFDPEIRELGLRMQVSPMAAEPDAKPLPLKPGSPVAAVLMQGDFSFAGTGTVTWMDDERVLAFGHPFFSMGEIAFPMANADILTVVRNLQSSFKLSNTGAIIGSFLQDRNPGIAGVLDQFVPLTQVDFDLAFPGGRKRHFEGQLIRHQNLSPLLAAISLSESLQSTVDVSEKMTLKLRATLGFEDGRQAVWEDTFADSSAPVMAARNWMGIHSLLVDPAYGGPAIKSIHFQVEMLPETEMTYLDALYVSDNQLNPGDSIKLRLQLKRQDGTRSIETVEVPLPDSARGEILDVFVGDGTSAAEVDYEGLFPASDFDHILNWLNQQRNHDQLYVLVLRRAPGLNLEGVQLEGVPPSVLALLQTDKGLRIEQGQNREVLLEQAFPMAGEFRGSALVSVKVK